MNPDAGAQALLDAMFGEGAWYRSPESLRDVYRHLATLVLEAYEVEVSA